MGVQQPFPLLHGPLLLLYVYSLIKPNPDFGKKEWLHFIPTIAFYILIFPDAFLQTKSELLEFAFETLKSDPPFYFVFFGFLINISGVVYVIWSLIALYRHKKNIKDKFSYTEKINLDWLMKLIMCMGVIWIIVLLSFENSGYIFIAVTGFVFVIGYFGSKQAAIFTDNSSGNNDKAGAIKSKYEKSTLTGEKSQEHLNSLKQLMNDEKPYLESKITLRDVSESLGIHQNHLSQIINEQLNQNFFDFINSYRVTEFKQRLEKDKSKKFTLLAHAYDSGFSSKSSFNEVFKKQTSLTPSQYQKQLSN